MKNISDDHPYVDIQCFSKTGERIGQMTESLTDTEICYLLNDYNVDKRGSQWSASMVKTAIKPYDPKVDIGDTPLSSFNDIDASLNNIVSELRSETKNNTKKRKKSLSFNNDSIARRSARLNPSRSNNIADTIDGMENDLKLFKEFKAFKNMMDRDKK